MVWMNQKTGHKDAYKAIFIKNILSSLDVYDTQTRGRSSTNRVNHKNKLSNKGMEHSGMHGETRIEEHTEFENACFANLVSIKKKRGNNFLGHS